MTLQEPRNQPSAELDGPDTHVMIAPLPPSPVFVDSSGRRSRLLRRTSYGFVALCMVYGGLVSVSLAGGPVSTNAILPLIADGSGAKTGTTLATPSPIPQPSTSSSAATAPKIVDAPAAPRQTHTLERAVVPKKPAAKPTRTKTPRATPSATKPVSHPVESATTTPPTPTATPTTTPPTPTATPTTKPAVAPKPPAGTGGLGGGEVVDETVSESPSPTESASTESASPEDEEEEDGDTGDLEVTE